MPKFELEIETHNTICLIYSLNLEYLKGNRIPLDIKILLSIEVRREMKSDDDLKSAGFTDSGVSRYKKTVIDFCTEVYTKSLALGDRDKSDDTPREVTHEHVRDAASELQRRGRNPKTPTQVWCQAGEYLFSGIAGLGAGKLNTSWGIATFGLSLTAGIVLFVIRNQEGRIK